MISGDILAVVMNSQIFLKVFSFYKTILLVNSESKNLVITAIAITVNFGLIKYPTHSISDYVMDIMR